MQPNRSLCFNAIRRLVVRLIGRSMSFALQPIFSLCLGGEGVGVKASESSEPQLIRSVSLRRSACQDRQALSGVAIVS